MLTVSIWDAVIDKWSQLELDLPPHTEDPIAINHAVHQKVGEPAWKIAGHSMIKPVLTITSRSGSGHLGLTIVNYEHQPQENE
jgi:hypothetical protein